MSDKGAAGTRNRELPIAKKRGDGLERRPPAGTRGRRPRNRAPLLAQERGDGPGPGTARQQGGEIRDAERIGVALRAVAFTPVSNESGLRPQRVFG